MVFYLKVNMDEAYSYKNLQNWLYVISCYGEHEAYIVCDSLEFQKKIIDIIKIPENVKIQFLTSHIYDDLDEVETILALFKGRFVGAGRAHLLTFFHAREKHLNAFWNIDADDTWICLSPERSAEALEQVQDYAEKNHIELFSLDMLDSRKKNLPGWTFGITYTDNKCDWIKCMLQYVNTEKRKEMWDIMQGGYAANIDTYFTFLQHFTNRIIRTFYFENMRFVHYYRDFFERPHGSGIFHWKDKELYYPFLLYVLGEANYGRIPIGKGIARMDIGISDEESFDAMKSRAVKGDWQKHYSAGNPTLPEIEERLLQFFRIGEA